MQPAQTRRLTLSLLQAANKWSGLLALLLAWHEEQLQDGVAVRLRHWLNSFNRRQIPPTPEQLRQCREAFTRTLPLAEEIASVLGLAIRGDGNFQKAAGPS